MIYSIGSLYTSIIPCLVLRDVGSKLASANVRYKILILNGSLDRETRAAGGLEFTAKDFIAAIADACVSSRSPSTAAVGTTIKAREEDFKLYVTHLIHLQGEGTPRVPKEELAQLGIECVKLYGRKNNSGDGGMIYDGTALGQAMEVSFCLRPPRALSPFFFRCVGVEEVGMCELLAKREHVLTCVF